MIGLILMTFGPIPAEVGSAATCTHWSKRFWTRTSQMLQCLPASMYHHIFPVSNNHGIYSDYAHRSKLEPLKKQRANTYPLNEKDSFCTM